MKNVPLALFAAAVALTLAAAVSTLGCMHTARPVSRAGVVSSVLGRARVTTGETCSVDVARESRASMNCRVTVRCGERVLFGGPMLGGYAECGVRGDRYSSASDPRPTARDGDPIVEVDLERGFARVADAGYEVRIALAER